MTRLSNSKDRKFKWRYLFLLLLALVMFYLIPTLASNYSFDERKAVMESFPYTTGEIVYEREYGDKSVYILETENRSYVKLIDRVWGVVYRASSVSALEAVSDDKKMHLSWNATQRDDGGYDVLFAAEIIDDDIVTVVVSNDKNSKKSKEISKVKQTSSVFIQMEVVDGYAANYSRLGNSNIGNFVFRGINSKGKVISID